MQPVYGEFSTSYVLHPLVPRRVLRNIPSARMIALLRNPVDRSFSHFMMDTRRMQVRKSSNEALDQSAVADQFDKVVRYEANSEDVKKLRALFAECSSWQSNPECLSEACLPSWPVQIQPQRQLVIESNMDLKKIFFNSYVLRSIYVDQVRRWLDVFPREQLLFLKSEDYFANPTDILRRAAAFIGLSPAFDFAPALARQNATWADTKNHYIIQGERPKSYEDMHESTRQFLIEYFRPWNTELSKLLGQDFEWD
eukprot:TRINITY_DN25745_c0_g1_i5.p1 TRINITY_DN25745_c0_g1~~TRINITY_DN25745_c0_g1_i5.p1  ORF type:complete len:254 (+),score=24.69 TRINITY_DN25745_c0_g1_i5:912-1673(+)